MISLPNIGKRLEHAREIKGLSKNAAAKQAGYSRHTLTNIESGENDKLRVIISLAEFYNTNLLDILFDNKSDSEATHIAATLPDSCRHFIKRIARAVEQLEDH